MVIRKAIDKDVEILNNYLTLLIKDEKQYDPGIDEDFEVTNMYDNYINDDSKLLIVAVEDEKVVGYLYGKIKQADPTYKYITARLGAIYVDSNYRNKGIATSLIEYFKKWSLEKEAHKLEVNVWSNNIKAKSIYEKAGFKTASETLTIFY